METVSNQQFGEAVVRFFQPLADRASLPLKKLREDIYEITGKGFILRIRRGTGHRKDFVVTLAPAESRSRDLDDLSDEIGLGVVTEYHGQELRAQDVSSLADFQSAVQDAAEMAGEFCLPYLLGTKTDYEEIRRFVERKVDESGIRTKQYNFPPNVREEWL